MKDLKITEGEHRALYPENSNGYWYVSTGEGFYETSATVLYGVHAEDEATLYADAHNTYQSTGMTASELAEKLLTFQKKDERKQKTIASQSVKIIELIKQRDELFEALKSSISNIYNGYKSENEVMHDMRAAIQSVEQNEKQK